MTSILLNDQYISLLDGMLDSDLIVLNSFVTIKTDLNLNEIAFEPSNQIKIENLIKDTMEKNGMATNKVVILFPDTHVFTKPIITEKNINPDEIKKILPVELKASFGDNYKPDKNSYYLIKDFNFS